MPIELSTDAPTPGVRWDPEQYQRFADHRGRPFADLLARVGATSPRRVADLGCGPGTLTLDLARRWPGARVEGVDSSPEMIAAARTAARTAGEEPAQEPGQEPGQEAGDDGERVRFVVGDVREWRPDEPPDVIVSNATLQWVPGHLGLLPRLADLLAPGGWLAVQVPGNFDAPSHTELAAVRTSPRWRPLLGGLTERASVEEPATYLAVLAEAGLLVDVWETTYHQVLPGEDAVLEWMKGTGLRPVLSALGDEDAAAFLAEYGERLRRAYPRRAFGTVLPYRRVFVVARRPAGG